MLWAVCPAQSVDHCEPDDTYAVYEAFSADPGAYDQPDMGGGGHTFAELDIDPSLCP